jgi:uncharacterized protein YukE
MNYSSFKDLFDVNGMKTGGSNMDISEMTEGVSEKGMEDYIDSLKAYLLTETTKIINDTSALEAAINSGWQGQSRDKFIEKFNEARMAISMDLKREFNDLNNRLAELLANYFAQDSKMIDII